MCSDFPGDAQLQRYINCTRGWRACGHMGGQCLVLSRARAHCESHADGNGLYGNQKAVCKARTCYDSPSRQLKNDRENFFPRFARKAHQRFAPLFTTFTTEPPFQISTSATAVIGGQCQLNSSNPQSTPIIIYYYINFNDNGRPGDPYVKSTDKYIYKYTLAKVKVYVFS